MPSSYKLIWSPDLEPPVILAEFFVHFPHGATEVECLSYAFLNQSGAAWWFHHGSSNIATGNDAVLGAGAGMHQIGLIEEVPIQFGILRILH